MKQSGELITPRFLERAHLRTDVSGGIRPVFAARLFGNDDESVAKRSDDPRSAHDAFDVEMLMTVKKPTRVRTVDVAIERGKADMNLIVAIVDHTRGVVCDEHVDARKRTKGGLNLGLFEKIVTFRLIFPGAAKPAEGNAVNGMSAEMQIDHWCLERCTAIVVAFDRENVPAATALSRSKNNFIRQVATGDEDIGSDVRQLVQQ